MTKIWNVGVVGTGIGRSHIAEGYNILPNKFRVLALCDIDRNPAILYDPDLRQHYQHDGRYRDRRSRPCQEGG